MSFPPLPPEALDEIRAYLLGLQKNICLTLESLDPGAHFKEDEWKRGAGGGGKTRILQGTIFEKAGVNFSEISGESLPPSATVNKPELSGRQFTALGVSVVIHPNNPYIPTSHANVRFFIASKNGEPDLWWFGGGFDLTPYYGFVEDCKHWHQTAKQACLPFGDSLHEQFKTWCDSYFYLKHRQEARGIGGLFFDDYHAVDFEHSFGLMRSIGDHFIQAYAPIVSKRKDMPFGSSEKNFQTQRRGRYVEFNLIYDRGTLFGLQSGGRTESILMSLPPTVSWEYNWIPEENSPEAALYRDFLPARDWLS